MRLKLRHETRYTYADPARGVIQVLRLTPRSHAGQFLKRWRVEIDADCRLERDEDAYGNILHTFSVDGPVESMRITVEGEVDTTNDGGLVRGGLERFPPSYWTSTTPLSAPSPRIAAFARELRAGEGGDRLAFLHGLMLGIHREFAFRVGVTDAQTDAKTVFERREGVCQDFAHVFLSAARSEGIPARYVSGYFLLTDSNEQVAGHAWAEAYLENVGWVGFDPANGVCIDERHLRVAVGRDYLDAAPVRGARFGGGGEALGVAVHLSARPSLLDQ